MAAELPSGGGSDERRGRAAADGGAARGRTAAVPHQDVRPGGRSRHRRRRLVGARRQQLHRVGSARVRRRAAPQILQAQQFLQLCPPAQYLSTWINKTTDEDTRNCLFVIEDSLDHHQAKHRTIGFRKIDSGRWEFANEGFLRGHRHLLRTMMRRRPPSYLAASQQQHQQALGSYLEFGHFGVDDEIERLKRDKNILLAEVVKLRQEQQSAKADVQAMEEWLQRAESKQVQMMGFLARAMQNPDFLHQLLLAHQHQGKGNELEDAFSKERRRSIHIIPAATASSCQTTAWQCEEELDSSAVLFRSSCRQFEELSEPRTSELENLALSIQGLGKRKHDENSQAGGGRSSNQDGETAELTDDFWKELLSEGMRGEGDMSVAEVEERRRPPPGRYVDALAQRLGLLSNSTAK